MSKLNSHLGTTRLIAIQELAIQRLWRFQLSVCASLTITGFSERALQTFASRALYNSARTFNTLALVLAFMTMWLFRELSEE